MIESVMQLGQAVYKENDIRNYHKKIDPIKNKKQLHILKIDFDLQDDKIRIDVNEEMSMQSGEKYNFIGSANGPSSPQSYVTSTSDKYILSENIPSLLDSDISDEFKEKLMKVLDNFYILVDEDLSKKYRYILDWGKYEKSKVDIREEYKSICKSTKDSKIRGRKILKRTSDEVSRILKEDFDISNNLIGLYTIFINGQPLASDPSYIDFVLSSKSGKIKENNEGICNFCMSEKDVTSKIEADIKFYTTNQIIFASGLDKKNYNKNMQLCSRCMKVYNSGETYLKNNLRFKLGNFNVYLIPQFIYGEPTTEREMSNFTNIIKERFKTVTALENIKDLREEILNRREDVSGYFLLNFIFFESAQQSTKVKLFIRDIDPSIFDQIEYASIRSYENIRKAIGFDIKTSVNLRTIYFMNPIKLKDGNPTQFRDILQTYDAILSKRKLDRKKIIRNIVDCTKIIRLEKPNYNINYQKTALEYYILQSNMYLKFLENMAIIKGGKGMDLEELDLEEKIKEYIKTMDYDEEETALFLMGIIIGKIGNAQYKSGNEKKPILNKLSYNGIDSQKLIRLTKDLFIKLNQEKIRNYNENIFHQMKKLLDKNLNQWKHDKNENIFYILSGYSYETTQAMRGRNKDE